MTPRLTLFAFLSSPTQSFQMKLFRLRKLFHCKNYRRKKKDRPKVFKCFPLIKINKKQLINCFFAFICRSNDCKISWNRFKEWCLHFFIIWTLLKNKDSFTRLLFIAENLRICRAAPSAYFCLLKQRFLIQHFLYCTHYH